MWERPDPPLDRETVDDIIKKLVSPAVARAGLA
jgi:hypothetical protein